MLQPLPISLLTVFFVSLLSWMCKTTKPATTAGKPPVLYYSEQLDTVLQEDNTLTVRTYRDVQPLLQVLAAQWGSHCAGYVTIMDTVMEGNFPADGPGNYRWKDLRFLGQQHAELAVEWSDFERTDLTFRFYNDLALPMADDPQVIKWLSALVKNNLLLQPLVTQPEPHREIYLRREISDLVAVDGMAFQQEIDRRLMDNPLGFYLSVSVDEKGQGQVENYDGPDTLKTFLHDWVGTLRFPILIYQEMRDTGIYHLDLEGRRSDQLAISRLQAACRRGQVAPLENDAENPYDRIPDLSGGLIAPETMHTPYPLLAVLGRAAHFFLVTPQAFIPAGSLPYDGETQTFQDYDFDGVPELQFESTPNMNGNTWSSLARWNPDSQKMEFAGRFSTFMEADTQQQRWMENYSGSWYMAQHQKLYGWSQHTLTPIRMIEVSLREQNMLPNSCCIVSLYENPVFELGIDSLRLVRDTFILNQDEEIYKTIFFGPEGRRQ